MIDPSGPCSLTGTRLMRQGLYQNTTQGARPEQVARQDGPQVAVGTEYGDGEIPDNGPGGRSRHKTPTPWVH